MEPRIEWRIPTRYNGKSEFNKDRQIKFVKVNSFINMLHCYSHETSFLSDGIVFETVFDDERLWKMHLTQKLFDWVKNKSFHFIKLWTFQGVSNI